MEKEAESKKSVWDIAKVLVFPLFINKGFILYFGLKYSKYPDEGYGYGLSLSLVFLILNIGRFLWKYKDVQDPW